MRYPRPNLAKTIVPQPYGLLLATLGVMSLVGCNQPASTVNPPPEPSPVASPVVEVPNSPEATTTPSPSITSLGQEPRSDESNPYQEQVEVQLEMAHLGLGLGDYEQTHGAYIDYMNGGMVDSLELSLDEGMDYAIVGVCDEDCTDLDLTLLNGNGDAISNDSEPDDFPLVSVTPDRTGTYVLEVDMYACADEPCFYGVGIFAKPIPLSGIYQ